jgi:hypothetical protein
MLLCKSYNCRYHARKTLYGIVKSHDITERCKKDVPFLITRATETLIWVILFTVNVLILRMIGSPIGYIDTYINILVSTLTHRDALWHVIVASLCLWRFGTVAEPLFFISYPYLSERRAQRSKRLYRLQYSAPADRRVRSGLPQRGHQSGNGEGQM